MSERLRRERFPILASIALVAFEALLAGLLTASAPAGMRWRGATIVNPADQAVYLNYIEQIRVGASFDHNLYAPEPQTASWHPAYWLLGWLARLTQWPSLLVEELGLCAATVIAVFCLHTVSRRLTKDERDARWATGLILFGGGLGWLYIAWHRAAGLAIGSYPVPDVGSEAFFFPAAFSGAHVALVLGLLPLALINLWDDLTKPLASRAPWHALTTAFLVWIHPYFAPLFAVYGLIALLISKLPWPMRLRRSILYVALALFALMPHAVSLLDNPSKRYLLTENPLPLKPVLAWVLAFLPLAALLLWRFRRRIALNEGERWIAAWLLSSIAVILLPWQWDRKLTADWGAAGIWLALPVLLPLRDWLKKQGRIALVAGTCVFALSPFMLLQSQLAWAKGAAGDRRELYVSNNVIAAWSWIRANTPSGATVLTDSTREGTWTPTFTLRHVWIGQNQETPDWAAKRATLLGIWQDFSVDEARAAIASTGANVILATDAAGRRRLRQILNGSSWHEAADFGDAAVWYTPQP